jgi:SOS-response transcriptional repressor LexA
MDSTEGPLSTSFPERLRSLRRQRGLTLQALGQLLDRSPQAISHWESSRSHVPSADLPALAAALGVAVADLFPSAAVSNVVGAVEERRAGGAPLMPVYRWGSCGDPRDRQAAPDPDRLDYAPLGRETLVGPRGFAVEVRGESMSHRDIHDGDVVWVNPERPVRVGGVVLARVWDEHGAEIGNVVKVFRHDDSGDRLWGDGEGENGRNPVLGSRFEVIGPVVLVTRTFPPR